MAYAPPNIGIIELLLLDSSGNVRDWSTPDLSKVLTIDPHVRIPRAHWREPSASRLEVPARRST